MVILYIEDSDSDQDLFEVAFERLHLDNELRVVSDAIEGIAYLEGRDEFADRSRYPLPDLIVLDLVLPWISGEQFLEWMNRTGFKYIPVIGLTDTIDPELLSNVVELGVLFVLPKPSTIAELTLMVQEFCQPDHCELSAARKQIIWANYGVTV